MEKYHCKIVYKAQCPEEVYDYLDEGEADIIITDINMPVTNGLEMTKQIKKIIHI